MSCIPSLRRWFHEVTSLGQVNSSSIDQPPIHMAFNFWHHPPTTAGTFSSPYPDNYWKDRHGKIESAMGRVYNNVVLKENRVDRSKAAAVSRRRLDRIPGKEWIVKEMQ